MKCEKCGTEYPSKFYFKDEGRLKRLICNKCYDSCSQEEIESFLSEPRPEAKEKMREFTDLCCKCLKQSTKTYNPIVKRWPWFLGYYSLGINIQYCDKCYKKVKSCDTYFKISYFSIIAIILFLVIGGGLSGGSDFLTNDFTSIIAFVLVFFLLSFGISSSSLKSRQGFEIIGKNKKNLKVKYKNKDYILESSFNKGTKLYEQKRFDEAEKQLRNALDIEPSSEEIMYNLALVYLEKKQYDLAWNMADQIKELDCKEIMNELENSGFKRN